MKIGYYRIFEEYQLDVAWGQSMLYKQPQLHPGAKPLVSLNYFDGFETFFIPIAASFVVFCRKQYREIHEWRTC